MQSLAPKPLAKWCQTMGNNEVAENKLAKSVPQNELTLVALRDQALELLLNKNTESGFESTAHRTKQGLQVDTTNLADKSKSQMLVEGSSRYSPPALGWDGFHLDTQWKGDYTITHTNGNQRRVEKDSFSYVGGMWDDIMSREDRSNVTMTRKDASGKPFQTYLPALSETVSEGRNQKLDPNGQPLRVARLAGSETNCGLDYSNSRGGNMDCNFLIRDAKFGKDISYNETREKFPSGFYYRSVLRDTAGKVLGIVNQSYNVDSNGDITNVRTSARRPEQIKK